MTEGVQDLVRAMRDLRDRFSLDVVACTTVGEADAITVRVTSSGPLEIENAAGWLLTSEEDR